MRFKNVFGAVAGTNAVAGAVQKFVVVLVREQVRFTSFVLVRERFRLRVKIKIGMRVRSRVR